MSHLVLIWSFLMLIARKYVQFLFQILDFHNVNLGPIAVKITWRTAVWPYLLYAVLLFVTSYVYATKNKVSLMQKCRKVF